VALRDYQNNILIMHDPTIPITFRVKAAIEALAYEYEMYELILHSTNVIRFDRGAYIRGYKGHKKSRPRDPRTGLPIQ
jgi:hypothetical protein